MLRPRRGRGVALPFAQDLVHLHAQQTRGRGSNVADMGEQRMKDHEKKSASTISGSSLQLDGIGNEHEHASGPLTTSGCCIFDVGTMGFGHRAGVNDDFI